MLAAALLGFCFGYIGSMPVAGPIAVLVFGRGLEDRARNGLFLASGAAIAESVYAYLAFWGFSAFLTRYPWIEPTSRVAAAVLLTGLGVHLYRRRPKPEGASVPQKNNGNKRSLFLGFTITALNPTLIATWTAAVTTVYSLDIVSFEASEALPFSFGAFSGIVGWFATLLYLMNRFKARFSRASIDRLVHVMGILLIGLGLGIAGRFAYRLAHTPLRPAHAQGSSGFNAGMSSRLLRT
jgi:threonine/homoserine/homoserine lactone efflux protein